MMKELIQNIHSGLDTYKEDFKNLYMLLSMPDRDDVRLFEEFATMFKRYPAHPVLLVLFTDCLQICTDEALLTQYELQDVKDLLVKGCDTYKDDIELNVEHYHFIKNIEDDDEEAEEYIASFRDRIDTLLHEDDGEI